MTNRKQETDLLYILSKKVMFCNENIELLEDAPGRCSASIYRHALNLEVDFYEVTHSKERDSFCFLTRALQAIM